MLSRAFCLEYKNGRFAFEPSVLCSTLAETATTTRNNFPAVDFLLRGRFARESWRAGAADTGRDKAEERGIPAVVFRPTTTQDVPASVRPRACAFRASRPFFLLKRKEDVRFESHVGESGWSGEGKLSRASRSVFLSRKKRKDPPGARSAFCRPCGRKAGSSRAQTAPQWETRTRSRRANERSRTARTPQGPAPRAAG